MNKQAFIKLITLASLAAFASSGWSALPTNGLSLRSINPSLQAFLGPQFSIPVQQLWTGRGGRSIVAAKDGTLIVFTSNKIRRSTDGGVTWNTESNGA